MKNLFAALIIIFPLLSSAQHVFMIEEMVNTKDMSVNALVINMTDDFDEAIANYKEFVKEGYELKVKKENSLTYTIEAVDLPHLSVKRGDLNTYLFHTDTTNVMAFSFLLGYDVFLTNKDNPEEMTQFRKFVMDYMDFHYKAHYSKEIDAHSDELESLKKALLKNENKISSLKKKVVTLAKKEDKEEDPTKKVGIGSELKLTQNEIDELVDQVTTMRVEVNKQEKELYALKDTLNKYHLQIVSL
jgi:hypothetical protein